MNWINHLKLSDARSQLYGQLRWQTNTHFAAIFRDLQDLQSFAPLRSQNFMIKRVTILAVLNNLRLVFKIIHSKFAFFKSKMRFFVKLLMKFCRNNRISRNAPNVKNFQFAEKKRIKIFEKSAKISEMFKLFRKLFKIIQSCP